MTGAEVEGVGPVGSGLDGEALVLDPDVGAAGDPGVDVLGVGRERRDEPGAGAPEGVVRGCDVAAGDLGRVGGPGAVVDGAVVRDRHGEVDVFGDDVAAVVRVDEGVAAVAAEVGA